VPDDDLADDGQAETGTGSRPRVQGAVEAVEYERKVLVGDAGTVVADGAVAAPQP
jgi:hypothetical protein